MLLLVTSTTPTLESDSSAAFMSGESMLYLRSVVCLELYPVESKESLKDPLSGAEPSNEVEIATPLPEPLSDAASYVSWAMLPDPMG